MFQEPIKDGVLVVYTQCSFLDTPLDPVSAIPLFVQNERYTARNLLFVSFDRKSQLQCVDIFSLP